MSVSEINFTFAGKHCVRDFGCLFVEQGGHPIGPKVTRNNYTIAGMSGTIQMPGATYGLLKFNGSLIPDPSPTTLAGLQQLTRRLSTWLQQGRCPLFFDYEPDVYYLAEVSDETRLAYDQWIDGGLTLAFECQPFAYRRVEQRASKATGAELVYLRLTVDTRHEAPLCLDVKNTGSAAITGVSVQAGGKQAAFAKALRLTEGQTLTISMEPPAGATIDGADAMPYATRFDYLAVPGGVTDVLVSLAYGAGERSVTVTARARGRY
ncbi:hypothetical protein LJC74_00995 [Eubacteriales bacterium OttesenSCG-928-A19]|nr:hypothetical protein [Eubacteriales bacterium OttesenSCG-928-A19]